MARPLDGGTRKLHGRSLAGRAPRDADRRQRLGLWQRTTIPQRRQLDAVARGATLDDCRELVASADEGDRRHRSAATVDEDRGLEDRSVRSDAVNGHVPSERAQQPHLPALSA
jgi:hypothetical protein